MTDRNTFNIWSSLWKTRLQRMKLHESCIRTTKWADHFHFCQDLISTLLSSARIIHRPSSHLLCIRTTFLPSIFHRWEFVGFAALFALRYSPFSRVTFGMWGAFKFLSRFRRRNGLNFTLIAAPRRVGWYSLIIWKWKFRNAPTSATFSTICKCG